MKKQPIYWNKDDYAKVYETYFPKLVRFSQSYVMSRYEAENVVQDIFLYLWEHPDLSGSLLSIQAFLFAMTKNRCIDFLREQTKTSGRKHLLVGLYEKEWELKLYSLQQLDENRLSVDELETVIRRAIDTLPERCRQIFIMSRIEGMRHKDIAEQLQISTNTIEGQIHIALKKLRIELKDYIPWIVFLMTNVKI